MERSNYESAVTDMAVEQEKRQRKALNAAVEYVL
jgi:hypothetical protein